MYDGSTANGRGDARAAADLLVIGAGPYGLATAAYAQHVGLDCRVLGQPMEFWWRHMPDGMYLRSGLDWHLDPLGERTLEAYVSAAGIDRGHLHPLPVGVFRDYGRWFQEVYGLAAEPRLVRRLVRREGRFVAQLEDGEHVAARQVLLALGFGSFTHLPAEVTRALPAGRYAHTCQLIDFRALAGQAVLIVGGRQSAYEWAALLAEAGAAAVHVVHRHPAPRFAPSDWSWVEPLLQASAEQPGWFRTLPPGDQEAIRQRFWAEGRLKLEPWLGPRIDRSEIRVWPETALATGHEGGDGRLQLRLTTDAVLDVDHVVLATGYRVDVRRVSLLDPETILPHLAVADGFPVLDEDFQSTVPGLFFSGLPATRDFGPFFGFVAGCRVAPRRIVSRILSNPGPSPPSAIGRSDEGSADVHSRASAS